MSGSVPVRVTVAVVVALVEVMAVSDGEGVSLLGLGAADVDGHVGVMGGRGSQSRSQGCEDKSSGDLHLGGVEKREFGACSECRSWLILNLVFDDVEKRVRTGEDSRFL